MSNVPAPHRSAPPASRTHDVGVGRSRPGSRGLFALGALLGTAALMAPFPAAADCSGGATITCSSAGGTQASTVGTGGTMPSGTTVEVQPGALVSTGNASGISLGDNALITVRSGATVQNASTGADSPYGGGIGANAIEFNNNGMLVVEQGATVQANATASDSEAVNTVGVNNTIINRGTIRATNAAIFSQANVGANTIVNEGTMEAGYVAGGTNSGLTPLVGAHGVTAVDFTNRGALIGSLIFGSLDDALRIYTGSSLTGQIDGGGGANLLTLNSDNAAADTFAPLSLAHFQTLVSNSGTWTFNAPLGASGITSATVHGGTLILGTDASSYTGSMTVDAAGILQSSAQFAPLSISNAGLVRFAQPDDASYGGAILGSGGIEKTGAGVLTLTRSQSFTGNTTVSAGTLRAAAAGILSAGSTHDVAAGATLDLAGFDQRVAGLSNAGVVSLVGTAPGTTLTVTGPYVGAGGVLRLGTFLGDSSSATDRLVLSGPAAVASGNTQIAITRLGGLGALTSGNGIEVVSAVNGASTAANAFTLANGHVDAGAYEYRLYDGDAFGLGESWYLRSNQPTAPAVPTYRAEVPLFAALPEQLRQMDLAMLGNLHQRIGDDDEPAPAGGANPDRRAWGRVISQGIDIRQRGTVSPRSDGRASGFQAGTDLLATRNWRAGVYVGQLDGNVDVSGLASGIAGLPVGRNDLRSQYLGLYGTYTSGTGFYADAVLQAARHRYDVQSTVSPSIPGRGQSTLASIEAGQSFRLGDRWTVEPQVQLVHQQMDLDDASIVGALVRQDPASSWLARVGLRVKGDMPTGAGRFQPYARLNLYHTGNRTDTARFIGPAGVTDIATPIGGTSTELAAGGTLTLSRATTLYGELGKLWATGGDARVRSSVQASLGLRVRW